MYIYVYVYMYMYTWLLHAFSALVNCLYKILNTGNEYFELSSDSYIAHKMLAADVTLFIVYALVRYLSCFVYLDTLTRTYIYFVYMYW